MDDAERIEPSWSGWGDPALRPDLSPAILELLRARLGVIGPRPAPASIADLELAPIRLPPATRRALVAIVGEPNAGGDHEARARHARGKSTLDLLALRSGETIEAPDLVLLPASHDETLTVLELCSDRGVAVVPFGGGTSVVGGVSPEAGTFAGSVALDLGRMNALIALDEESRTATLGPGLRGPEAEGLLNRRGYTIGHFPQSFQYATLGGFAAARSSGQASAGYGRFDELVMALRVATPVGTLILGRAPKAAAGPDLRQLVLGSEGAFGVLTELTVTVRPVPEHRIYEGWRLPDFAAGLAALRRLAQDIPAPTVLRLSDEPETALGRALGEGTLSGAEPTARAGGTGCLAIVGWEGAVHDVRYRREAATRVLRAVGATQVAGAGDAWVLKRYSGPYLRDALLDAGALVETLETATFWSSLGRLYSAITAALRESLTAQGTPPLVLCHLSHTYPAGASLYFTTVCAQLPDPIAQWRRAKAAASEAILRAGGTISHHHGIGRDHRQGLARELGELGIGVLEAIKAKLDPAGILNPGVLIAE